jgi:urease beta subunit
VVKNNIGSRTQIRVEPDEPLIATVQFNGSASEIPVPLADISAGGASVYFETYMFPARLAQPGNELTMTISLPDSVSNKIKKSNLPSRTNHTDRQDGKIVITTSGRVIGVQSEFHLKRYRVNMKLFFKDLSRVVILQYIAKRQSEIIQDLRILSDDLYSRKK